MIEHWIIAALYLCGILAFLTYEHQLESLKAFRAQDWFKLAVWPLTIICFHLENFLYAILRKRA